jgi:hypothetical protein
MTCVNEEMKESCSIILSQANGQLFSGPTALVSPDRIEYNSREVCSDSLSTENSRQCNTVSILRLLTQCSWVCEFKSIAGNETAAIHPVSRRYTD